MRLVAVDPGETTGFAVYDTEAKELVASGELFGNFRGCVNYVLALGDFFIVEDFRVRPHAARGLARLKRLWPVEWLGAFRYAVPDRFITQTPAQAKRIDIGGQPYASEHQADAVRHLLFFIRPRATGERVNLALKALEARSSSAVVAEMRGTFDSP